MPNTPTRPKIPPIRTGLHEVPALASNGQAADAGTGDAPDPNAPAAAQQGRIAKEWYYYWTAVGQLLNQNTQILGGLVTYGPHANRPDPSTMPDGAVYVENDRHGTIYQNRLVSGKPAWVYSAGTMWGTISPDQRPIDLGLNDSGFEYRTTDQPPRQFLWSGTGWVEVTAVRYDTHSNRLAAVVSTVEQGMLWVETDRGEVIYQLQATTWHYSAGTMSGTLAPDQRPTDLGANDTGFGYRGTDQVRQFYWNGSAWVETTPQNNTVQIAYCSAGLTLTTSMQSVPGTSLTLAKAGTYLVQASFRFIFDSGDNTQFLQLGVAWSANNALVRVNALTAGQFLDSMISQQWLYTATAGATINLQAQKSGGTGTSSVQPYTSISALWVSP